MSSSDWMAPSWIAPSWNPRRKVFVSFDWDHDRDYKFLLNAWSANRNIDFTFSDQTPSEIQSDDIGRIKAAITSNINQSTHTLVIVGSYANTRHKDSAKIGFTNWINFEVHQSKLNGNKIVAVYINWLNEPPSEFFGYEIRSVYGFDLKPIIDALNAA